MTLSENIKEYQKQLEKGIIQKAYLGLMEYILSLRTYFTNKYPDYFVSGSLYQGYMDMTYFAFTPKSLKNRKLKIAIVFAYETFQFEVWLGGYNKQVQAKYWKIFKESNWDRYPVVSSIDGIDAIVEFVLIENPDFKDLDGMTKQIESGTLKFIEDIEVFLSALESNIK